MTIDQEKAWNSACRAWSLDDGKDPEKTGALGERLMYAATDLICALQGEIESRDMKQDAAGVQIQTVYRYILNRWYKAKVAGNTQRAIHLFEALGTIRAEWPEEIAETEMTA